MSFPLEKSEEVDNFDPLLHIRMEISLAIL